jgi:hypothetical protein
MNKFIAALNADTREGTRVSARRTGVFAAKELGIEEEYARNAQAGWPGFVHSGHVSPGHPVTHALRSCFEALAIQAAALIEPTRICFLYPNVDRIVKAYPRLSLICEYVIPIKRLGDATRVSVAKKYEKELGLTVHYSDLTSQQLDSIKTGDVFIVIDGAYYLQDRLAKAILAKGGVIMSAHNIYRASKKVRLWKVPLITTRKSDSTALKWSHRAGKQLWMTEGEYIAADLHATWDKVGGYGGNSLCKDGVKGDKIYHFAYGNAAPYHHPLPGWVVGDGVILDTTFSISLGKTGYCGITLVRYDSAPQAPPLKLPDSVKAAAAPAIYTETVGKQMNLSLHRAVIREGVDLNDEEFTTEVNKSTESLAERALESTRAVLRQGSRMDRLKVAWEPWCTIGAGPIERRKWLEDPAAKLPLVTMSIAVIAVVLLVLAFRFRSPFSKVIAFIFSILSIRGKGVFMAGRPKGMRRNVARLLPVMYCCKEGYGETEHHFGLEYSEKPCPNLLPKLVIAPSPPVLVGRPHTCEHTLTHAAATRQLARADKVLTLLENGEATFNPVVEAGPAWPAQQMAPGLTNGLYLPVMNSLEEQQSWGYEEPYIEYVVSAATQLGSYLDDPEFVDYEGWIDTSSGGKKRKRLDACVTSDASTGEQYGKFVAIVKDENTAKGISLGGPNGLTVLTEAKPRLVLIRHAAFTNVSGPVGHSCYRRIKSRNALSESVPMTIRTPGGRTIYLRVVLGAYAFDELGNRIGLALAKTDGEGFGQVEFHSDQAGHDSSMWSCIKQAILATVMRPGQGRAGKSAGYLHAYRVLSENIGLLTCKGKLRFKVPGTMPSGSDETTWMNSEANTAVKLANFMKIADELNVDLNVTLAIGGDDAAGGASIAFLGYPSPKTATLETLTNLRASLHDKVYWMAKYEKKIYWELELKIGGRRNSVYPLYFYSHLLTPMEEGHEKGYEWCLTPQIARAMVKFAHSNLDIISKRGLENIAGALVGNYPMWTNLPILGTIVNTLLLDDSRGHKLIDTWGGARAEETTPYKYHGMSSIVVPDRDFVIAANGLNDEMIWAVEDFVMEHLRHGPDGVCPAPNHPAWIHFEQLGINSGFPLAESTIVHGIYDSEEADWLVHDVTAPLQRVVPMSTPVMPSGLPFILATCLFSPVFEECMKFAFENVLIKQGIGGDIITSSVITGCVYGIFEHLVNRMTIGEHWVVCLQRMLAHTWFCSASTLVQQVVRHVGWNVGVLCLNKVGIAANGNSRLQCLVEPLIYGMAKKKQHKDKKKNKSIIRSVTEKVEKEVTKRLTDDEWLDWFWDAAKYAGRTALSAAPFVMAALDKPRVADCPVHPRANVKNASRMSAVPASQVISGGRSCISVDGARTILCQHSVPTMLLRRKLGETGQAGMGFVSTGGLATFESMEHVTTPAGSDVDILTTRLYLMPLGGEASRGELLFSLPLDISQGPLTTTRLATLARLYERHKIMAFNVVYVPTCDVTVGGAIGFVGATDPSRTIAFFPVGEDRIRAATEYGNHCAQSRIWENMVYSVPLDERVSYQEMQPDVTSSVRWRAPGTVEMLCFGSFDNQDVTPGYVMIEAIVAYINPVPPPTSATSLVTSSSTFMHGSDDTVRCIAGLGTSRTTNDIFNTATEGPFCKSNGDSTQFSFYDSGAPTGTTVGGTLTQMENWTPGGVASLGFTSLSFSADQLELGCPIGDWEFVTQCGHAGGVCGGIQVAAVQSDGITVTGQLNSIPFGASGTGRLYTGGYLVHVERAGSSVNLTRESGVAIPGTASQTFLSLEVRRVSSAFERYPRFVRDALKRNDGKLYHHEMACLKIDPTQPTKLYPGGADAEEENEGFCVVEKYSSRRAANVK